MPGNKVSSGQKLEAVQPAAATIDHSSRVPPNCEKAAAWCGFTLYKPMNLRNIHVYLLSTFLCFRGFATEAPMDACFICALKYLLWWNNMSGLYRLFV